MCPDIYVSQKKQICHVDNESIAMLSEMHHFRVTYFLVEMTNFHVILTKECSNVPLITYSVFNVYKFLATCMI